MTPAWRAIFCVLFAVGLAWLTPRAWLAADEPQAAEEDFSAELPRIEPVEPADAVDTMIVQPGFAMQQVAAEPLVADPVAVSFDEDGRLYVVEMRGYSEEPDDKLSRVRMLEDTDGDGRFDRSTVFVDELSWPTAIICYDGGAFIGDAPDLFYCKDTNGDGRADERRTVYSGFGKSNVQGLFNSFAWGLDNRIHVATSSSGAEIRRADDPAAAPLRLSGRDFAFDPRTLVLEPTSGGGQHGMSFDDWGRKFVCSNSDHIQQVMFEDRYLARNPYLSAPGARLSIAADGPQAEVFRASPVEPWRVVRTRLRVSGAVPGPVEGGGRAAGYFTGATGVTIYRGDAWPESLRGLAVVGDVGSNLIHRKRLEPNGLELVARRIDEKSELVASRDIWFRPCQYANAPDGTLYVLDVYREVIEHPASLPPVIKRHLDLTSGRDRGRIYRIVPEGFKQPPLPGYSRATTAELTQALAHPASWHRETAARLLFERQDPAAIPLLEELVRASKAPLARLHALYVLDGLKATDGAKSLAPAVLLAALADAHPQVRAHAVRLAESRANDVAELRDALLLLAGDDDLHVRYQVAFSLGELKSPDRLPALARIARRDAADRWVSLALLSSLAEGAGDVLAELAADGKFRQTDAGGKFLSSLARQAGLTNRPADVAAVLKAIEGLPEAEKNAAQILVKGLSEGLAQRGSPLGAALGDGESSRARQALADLLTAAHATALDAEAPAPQRVEAVATLALGAFEAASDALTTLLDNRQPQEVQVAALGSLARYDDAGVAPLVLAAWPSLSPRLRVQATEAMFARPERLAALLAAIEAGDVNASDIEPARWQLLTALPDESLREQAKKLAAGLSLGRRQEVVAEYRDVLQLTGDLERGKQAFKKVCAACHKAEGFGHEIGPNLATLKNRGADAILTNVLDPSREVNPQYVNYVLITDDGRSMTGMIAAETANSVTLKRAENASDTVLRINIEALQGTGLSLMPEGVEKQLDRQALADLIAYLLALK